MSKKGKSKTKQNFVTQNRKARFEFQVLEKFEAGIVLRGSEVKSLREGKASLEEAYAMIDSKREVYLLHSHIPEYPAASLFNHEPKRKRKLLLHRAEVLKIQSRLREKGLTLIPLSIYFSKKNAKVELAIAKGKRKYDKRQTIKRREAKREMDRVLTRKR